MGDVYLLVVFLIVGMIEFVMGIVIVLNILVIGCYLGVELMVVLGWDLLMVNDCIVFVWFEVYGGVGEGVCLVMGLVMGMGVGVGIVVDGCVLLCYVGILVEIGYLGMFVWVLVWYGLLMWCCGCGWDGCYENYVLGMGLWCIVEWVGLVEIDF